MRKIFPGNEKKAGVTGDSLLSAAMTALVDEPVTARLSFNNNRKIVEISNILFSGKRKIDWDSVENYLKKYIGESYHIDEMDDVVYIGTDFPDEFAHSRYSARAFGTIGKAKANAAQAIPELVKTATNIVFRNNEAIKHTKDAKFGWYRCTVYFTLPITNDKAEVVGKNEFQGRMLIRCDENGRKYLYDIIDIKKET